MKSTHHRFIDEQGDGEQIYKFKILIIPVIYLDISDERKADATQELTRLYFAGAKLNWRHIFGKIEVFQSENANIRLLVQYYLFYICFVLTNEKYIGHIIAFLKASLFGVFRAMFIQINYLLKNMTSGEDITRRIQKHGRRYSHIWCPTVRLVRHDDWKKYVGHVTTSVLKHGC